MMRKLLLLGILLVNFNLYARDSDLLTYFNNEWQPTTKNQAVYIRKTIKKSDSLYIVTDYNNKMKLLMKGEYSSIDPMVENGYFEFYDIDNFKKVATGYYYNGIMKGEWNYINYNSYITKKVNYDIPILDFKVSDAYIVVDIDPKFGDTTSFDIFRKYLGENLIYPPMAVKYSIEGKIIVEFVIDETGHVCSVAVLTNGNKDLEREACRVLEQSPEWTPGYFKGEKVKTKLVFPFKFKLG